MTTFGLIGNCAISALIDQEARIVWSCFPRFANDPGQRSSVLPLARRRRRVRLFGIELADRVSIEQGCVENTALLETIMRGSQGSGIEIIDFAPRFEPCGRMFHPATLVRIDEPLGEAPRIRSAAARSTVTGPSCR